MSNHAIKQFLARVPNGLAIAIGLALAVMVAGASAQVVAMYKTLNRQAAALSAAGFDLDAHLASVLPMYGLYALALVVAALAGYGTVRLVRHIERIDAERWRGRAFWLGLALPVVSLAGLMLLDSAREEDPGFTWQAAWQAWGGLSMLATLVWACAVRVGLPRGQALPISWLQGLVLVAAWIAWLVGNWLFASATAGAALLLGPLMIWLLWPSVYRMLGLGLGVALLVTFLTKLWWLMPYPAVMRLFRLFDNSDPLGVNFQYLQATRSLAHSEWWGHTQTDFPVLHFLPRAQDQYLLTSFAEFYGLLPAGLLAVVVMALLIWALLIGWLGRGLSRVGPVADGVAALRVALALVLLSQAVLAVLTGFAWVKVPVGMGMPILTAHTGMALWAGCLGGLLWLRLTAAPASSIVAPAAHTSTQATI